MTAIAAFFQAFVVISVTVTSVAAEPCSVSLTHQLSRASCKGPAATPPAKGGAFGCLNSTAVPAQHAMWVTGGCRGVFTCDGVAGVSCASLSGNPNNAYQECGCGGGDLPTAAPTQSPTARPLQRFVPSQILLSYGDKLDEVVVRFGTGTAGPPPPGAAPTVLYRVRGSIEPYRLATGATQAFLAGPLPSPNGRTVYLHGVKLGGLQPGTKYEFTVGIPCSNATWSPTNTFTTRAPTDKSATVVFFGDTGNNERWWTNGTVPAVAARLSDRALPRVDAVIHTARRRRSLAEHLITTKALRCTATAWNLIVARCTAIPPYARATWPTRGRIPTARWATNTSAS